MAAGWRSDKSIQPGQFKVIQPVLVSYDSDTTSRMNFASMNTKCPVSELAGINATD